MEQVYIEEQTFDKINFEENPLAKGEYDSCVFQDCNFSNTDIAGVKFSKCVFTGCNLSLAKLTKTAFWDVKFKDCKMLGLHFEHRSIKQKSRKPYSEAQNCKKPISLSAI